MNQALITAPEKPEEWFDQVFWHYYPRRQNKAGARRLFLQIVNGKHRDLTADARDICVGAFQYRKFVTVTGIERQYIKLPTTWLNNGCWDDELTLPAAQPTLAKQQPVVSTRQRSLQEDLTDTSWAE